MIAVINAIVLEAAYQLTRDIETWDRTAWLLRWAPEAWTARLMVALARP
jgi:hypothetical protein